jgi:hypothetical protein
LVIAFAKRSWYVDSQAILSQKSALIRLILAKHEVHMGETGYAYDLPVAKLLSLGAPPEFSPRLDYLALGLTEEHVPELIRILQDEDLNQADSESDEVWAPLHALRALGALHAVAAVDPLVAMLPRVDDYGEAWILDEFPHIFKQIGAAAIPALVNFLADEQRGMWARAAAADSLAAIGQDYPERRGTCVAALTAALQHFQTQPEELNGTIINALVDLNAVEAASVMEAAYRANRVDISIVGDWEDAQIELGLLDERITPKPPYTWLREAEEESGEQKEMRAQRRVENRRQRQAKAKAKAKRKQAHKQRRRKKK